MITGYERGYTGRAILLPAGNDSRRIFIPVSRSCT
jgi:hypothetical protein